MRAAEGTEPPGVKSSLWSDTLLLLSLRRRVAWNSFRVRKPTTKAFSVIGGLAIFLMFAALSAGVGTLAGVILRRFPELGLEPAIPGVILTAATLFLLVGSFGTALGSLFLSSDLELLMTAPVDRKAVFVSKILDGMVWNYVLISALAVPALLTYGIGLHYGPLYYVLVLVTLVGTPLLPAGLGALLVLFVARFAPARRVREVLGLMGALFGIGCGLLGQTSRFWFGAFANTGGATKPEELLRSVREAVALPFPPFMAGRGLQAAGRGNIVGAVGNLSVFLLLTFGFFLVCVYLADYMYATGWVRMQSSGSSKRSKQRAERAERESGWLGRVSADVAIAVKDWKVIPRDLRNFAQMLAPLIFWPIFYINITAGGGGRDVHNPVPGLFLGGVSVAAGVLGSTVMLIGNIAFSSISREGKAWWLLKIAPLSTFELIRGKFLAAAIPFALISTALMAIASIWRRLDPVWSLYGWAGIEMLGLAMLAVGVALSIPWARLDWDDPRKMNGGWGPFIAFGVWLLMAAICGAFLSAPVLVEGLNAAFTPVAAIIGFAAATAIAAGAAYLAYKYGESRLPES